jgi:hypothetical protein
MPPIFHGWKGVTLDWYGKLFANRMMQAALHSLVIAVVSATITSLWHPDRHAFAPLALPARKVIRTSLFIMMKSPTRHRISLLVCSWPCRFPWVLTMLMAMSHCACRSWHHGARTFARL